MSAVKMKITGAYGQGYRHLPWLAKQRVTWPLGQLQLTDDAIALVMPGLRGIGSRMIPIESITAVELRKPPLYPAAFRVIRFRSSQPEVDRIDFAAFQPWSRYSIT
jgi:hypothetical protein